MTERDYVSLAADYPDELPILVRCLLALFVFGWYFGLGYVALHFLVKYW